MLRLALALIPLIATPATSAEVVTPEAFRALTEGRTLHFTLDGAPFGAEQFFADRRSLWRFSDGSCQPGQWDVQGDEICFVYGSDPTPICWVFRLDGPRFVAHLMEGGTEAGFSLDLDRVAPEPLPCPGPPVGS